MSQGDRISVYWPDDDRWYGGHVYSQDSAGCWVHYDDGDKQLHDLKVEQYKVVSGHKCRRSGPSLAEQVANQVNERLAEMNADLKVRVTNPFDTEYDEAVQALFSQFPVAPADFVGMVYQRQYAQGPKRSVVALMHLFSAFLNLMPL